MTSKLSHRRRTVRRMTPELPGASTVKSLDVRPRNSAEAAQKSRRAGPSDGTSGRSDFELALPVLTASSSPLPRGKAKSVLRALRHPFRNEKGGSSRGSGATTPVSPSPPLAIAPDDSLRTANVQMDGDDFDDRRTTFAEPAGPRQAAGPSSSSSQAPQFATSLNDKPPPAQRPDRPRHSASMHTLRSTLTTTCREASLPTGVPEPKSGNFPHQHLVGNLQHFARYSSAAYGQSFLRIFGIAKHEFKFPHTEIHANNHAFAHHVGIHVEDILLSSFTDPGPTFATDKISQIVNYGEYGGYPPASTDPALTDGTFPVAVDHSVKAVVLACRGSLGLADILTDLTCSYEPIPIPDGDPDGTYYVHSGMYCSSTTLQRGTVHDVIADALAKYPEYGLVLCGHR